MTATHVHAPTGVPTWSIAAAVAGALWAFTAWSAFVVDEHGAPHELFACGLAAAAICTLITPLIGLSQSRRGEDAREHQAMLNELDDIRGTLAVAGRELGRQVEEQQHLAGAIGANAAVLEQMSARLADGAGQDRVEWQSYAAAASDLLGLRGGGADVIPLPTHRKGP